MDRRIALMYVLLSMKDDAWVSAAESRLHGSLDPEGKIALLFALQYEQTDAADRVIADTANDASQPEAVRKQAQEFRHAAPPPSRPGNSANVALEELRQKRRERLRAVSDEAMDDVQSMTAKLAKLRAKAAR